jgi:RNA polymerase sigma-70 factor, ECF subfamily
MSQTFESTQKSEIFESYRPLLFSIAYRMLGSVMEAEDIVQDAYLRYEATPLAGIQSPKAFLSTVTTRLCLDQFKSARAQRETYFGPWLPEPLLTAETAITLVNKHEMISMAFLVLLENLSPLERAVFLLREVFDYSYAEIAQIVEKSEANCRQYYHRARQYLVERRPRFEVVSANQHKLINEFLQAVQTGDLEILTQVLAEDVTLWSDGGGKVHSAPRPLIGREIVMRLLHGLFRKRPSNLQAEIIEVNDALSLLLRVEDKVVGVMNFAGDGTRIGEIRTVYNPEKLQHLQNLNSNSASANT